MTREELVEIVKRNDSDKLFAFRLREALGLPQPKKQGKTRDRDAKRRKYCGAKKLMKQRYGVRL